MELIGKSKLTICGENGHILEESLALGISVHIYPEQSIEILGNFLNIVRTFR